MIVTLRPPARVVPKMTHILTTGSTKAKYRFQSLLKILLLKLETVHRNIATLIKTAMDGWNLVGHRLVLHIIKTNDSRFSLRIETSKDGLTCSKFEFFE